MAMKREPASSAPTALFATLEEILLEDIRFERAARLARHDEKSSGGIDLAFDCSNLCRVGRVEYQKRRAALTPERLCQHLRTEARSAHAEEYDVREALLSDIFG